MVACGSLVRLVLVVSLVLAGAAGSAALAQGLSPLEAGKKAEAPPPPRNALNKADLEFYVRHLYIWAPQIEVEIGDPKPTAIEGLLEVPVRASFQGNSKELALYVSKDGQHIFEGNTYNVGENPFRETIEKITNIDQPGFGKEGAPVVIAVFSDFQCPYCAAEAKVLRTQVPAAYPEQVRVYFHDFPLQAHKWAKPAALAGRCIYGLDPAVFWDYHDWIFENQKSITEQNVSAKVMEFAGGKGLDPLKLSPCIEKRETEAKIDESIKEGMAVGVSSTPTLFINGRRVPGSLQWEQLKQIIDYEIEYQKVAKNAGDDCGCEVSVPFPGLEKAKLE